jgi:hypothetical protein
MLTQRIDCRDISYQSRERRWLARAVVVTLTTCGIDSTTLRMCTAESAAMATLGYG